MLTQKFLMINSIIMVFVSCIISYMAVKNLNMGMIFVKGLRSVKREYEMKHVSREIKRYAKAVNIKLTIAEKMNIIFIERANIRRFVPFFDIKILAFIIAATFIFLISKVNNIIKFIPTSMLISALISLWPFVILDVMGRYNSGGVRRKLSEFISVLNRWCAVKEDIFYAFEKSLDSGIEEPLKSFISDMVIQVKRGIDREYALEMLQMKVGNAQFADFIMNIKQNLRSRGDIGILLSNLEEQHYKIEEEYVRRKISTFHDRIIIYFVMAAVLGIGAYLIKVSPEAREFYLGTYGGKNMLGLFSLLYSIGVYVTLTINKFRY